MATEISDDIKIYLDEIAERLWSNHAAVMVGAGFSKNSNPAFLDWNQLGDIFYKKIYGHPPDGKQCYLNVLKLADEVQAAFGRPVLDHLLRSMIPDNNSKPSLLHNDLLELPWTDVFTTNYDTLLERASKDIVSKKFDVVVNKEDLVYSEKPRIVKLHGSFPSKRPFIITEEDYRKYPREFAPFVNTVRQALLENTLCLIGFSGDDPNFLQWIGWIRDNLGDKNTPKIYFIGIFNGHDAKKKLLEQWNIITIDLSRSLGVGSDHAKALGVFFKYLKDSKQDYNQLEWPKNYGAMNFDPQKDIVSQINIIVSEWEKQRVSFPNWIIVPEDRRDTLWVYTTNWVNNRPFSKELEAPLDIDFLYELNWRLEKSLCPIFNNIIENYEAIIGRYNPFPDFVKIDSSKICRGDIIYENLPWDKIQIKWLELHISLIRYYREEGFLDKWLIIDERLQKLKGILSPEITARWHYERCLHALFSLNINRFQSILKDWPTNDSFPFWEAKRAGLIAEFGNLEAAEKILERSLNSIRSQLNLSPALNDYRLISEESYVMQLFQYIKDALIWKREDNTEREEIRQKFSERWNSLKQFKCDPWKEYMLFEAYLEHDPTNKPPIKEEYGFDIGQVTINNHFGGENKEILIAYNFLRFIEETGMPFRIHGATFGKEAAKGALKRISEYSPNWALATLLRIGDSKLVDSMFTRESIYKIQRDRIDRLIHEYLQVLYDTKSQIEAGDRFYNQNYGIQIAGIIPEILSRLCSKCSENAKEQIFNFLKVVFRSEHKQKYKGISNLVKRMIVSWPKELQYRNLSKLLKMPILTTLSPYEENEYPEPFRFVSLKKKDIIGFETIQIDNNEIILLIKKAESNDTEERKRSIVRLTC